MNPIHTILVATDFSSVAYNAVRRAALLAREHDARLSILHVIDRNADYCPGNRFSLAIDPALRAAQAGLFLRRIADELKQAFDVQADLVVKMGDALDVLVSESHGASLVVYGQRPGASLKELVLGTPADRLLDACDRPVLVVKQAVKGPYQRVLTGFNFTSASDAAALAAATLVPDADQQLMHVVRSSRDDAPRQPDAPGAISHRLHARQEAGLVARMQRRVATIGFDSRELRFAVGRGPSASTILSLEQAQGADVVAVGRQRRSKWLDALLGSVSRSVIARAKGDVLVVPGSPGSSMGSRVAAARRLEGGRLNSAALARRAWTIEADPANTRPPSWSTGSGVLPGKPLGAAAR